VGFEPSPDSRSSLSNRFFAALFPFFCWRCFVVRVEYWAGEERDGWKNTELPSLRKDTVRRDLEREKSSEPEDGQLSSVWQSERLERRQKEHKRRSRAALPVQRLLPSFFGFVAVVFVFFPPFFFFTDGLVEVSRGFFMTCASDCQVVVCWGCGCKWRISVGKGRAEIIASLQECPFCEDKEAAQCEG